MTMATLKRDLAAIKKIAKDWRIGWNRSDVEALLSLCADDIVLMPQGQPAVIGKNAIRPMYQSLFKEYTVKGEGEVVEVGVSGDLGYFWNSYSLTATSKAGGERIISEGKSIFIVRRQADHTWKIARLIDNSDQEQ